jgi:hypothetical protein
MIEKFVQTKISIVIALLSMTYISYYLLLSDNYLHSSITCIINYAHNLAITKHLLILGFLPIYIAIMIFGAATAGLYLGASVQIILSRLVKKLT